MNLPKAKKFGGIALAVHLKAALDEIVALHSEAYALMGSSTKESISDQLEQAVELLVKKYNDEHGPFPVTPKERKEHVARLAESIGREMRDGLGNQPATSPSSKSA